jgi:DDE superfamily endonuclease
MRYEFLPPYSPDYNPIELAFSCLKYRLRRNGDIVRITMADDADDSEVYDILYRLVWSITEHEAFGWFRYCGYA